MSNKLVPNLADQESRDWWKAIETAARNARKLDSQRKPFPKSSEVKTDQPQRGRASTRR